MSNKKSSLCADPDRATKRVLVALRLLETTDVHSNLMPFDYFAGRPTERFGLARIATMIRQARSEVANCLLFDNGDFLQGAPISDLNADRNNGWSGPNPAVAAMNLLGYDAVNLGNHEFNFGIDWLKGALKDARFPIVSANVITQVAQQPDDDETLYPATILLNRELADEDGQVQSLKIGVVGVLPPQIVTWDHRHLDGRVSSRDMVETVAAYVPLLRQRGADLVIVLAHCGMDDQPYYKFQENAAMTIAQINGVDALMAGHTHEVFPARKASSQPGQDHASGTLHGVPTVMAGFRGSHLGVLDLVLEKDVTTQKWRVVGHKSEARADTGAEAADKKIMESLEPAHQHTLQLVEQPLGRSSTSLTSYLGLVRDDRAVHLVNQAQRAALAARITGTPYADLPLLSASAHFKTGGRGGPDYYTDIPPGDICLRHASDLYAFPNTLCGLLVTGAELREWLERTAICFNQIKVGRDGQALCDPHVPGHNFDTIYGLSYVFDLSQPNRYDILGNLVNPSAQRVRDLRFDGAIVRGEDQFVVAVNSYRAFGGGPFARPAPESVIEVGQKPIRDILADFIRARSEVGAAAPKTWSFAPLGGTDVLFDTGPGVRGHLKELAELEATDCGDTADGFARLSLRL